MANDMAVDVAMAVADSFKNRPKTLILTNPPMWVVGWPSPSKYKLKPGTWAFKTEYKLTDPFAKAVVKRMNDSSYQWDFKHYDDIPPEVHAMLLLLGVA